MDDEFQCSSIISMMPEALRNREKTLLTLKQTMTAECKRRISFFEKEDAKSKHFLQQLLEEKRTMQEEIKQMKSDTENIKKEVYDLDLQQNILRNNIVSMKQHLPSAKEFPNEEELSKLMEKVSSLKEAIGKKKSAVKNELEKFKRGILFYRKYLHCKVFLDSKDILIITFDTSAKTATEVRDFLKFSIHGQGRDTCFQFVEMRPKLKSEQQLVKTFSETGDIQGFIVSFWNSTRKINSRKILGEKNTG